MQKAYYFSLSFPFVIFCGKILLSFDINTQIYDVFNQVNLPHLHNIIAKYPNPTNFNQEALVTKGNRFGDPQQGPAFRHSNSGLQT